jgi:hypothetical protein
MKKSLSYINPSASFNRLQKKSIYDDLPKVKIPLINTLIYTPDKIDLSISDKQRVIIKNLTDDFDNYKIDKTKQLIIFYDGREFKLDTLTNLSSRTGKSIEKSDAVELANTYLKLGIPSKSKKSIFIKAIREKLKLDS